MKSRAKSELGTIGVILCCAVLLSSFTVYFQKEAGWLKGQLSETGVQIERHRSVLQGTAGDPWQYRVLSAYLVEGFIRIVSGLGVAHPIYRAFILFRVLQNILLFSMASLYYKRLGLNTYIVLIGLSALAWGMTHAFYDSDLSFSTYFDVIFYLSAGLLILRKEYMWIIPLTGLAALNRETSALIPFMSLWQSFNSNDGRRKGTILLSAVSGVLFVVIFLSLRCILGPQELLVPHDTHPGFELFKYNVGRRRTWMQLLATLGVLPIMALFSFDRWPRPLKTFFWTIIPIWLLVHLFLSVMAETRTLLVPQALIFVPGALFGIEKWSQKSSTMR